jgi:peptidoglycan hydrolase-like protein with peptidoglycan-binding domain
MKFGSMTSIGIVIAVVFAAYISAPLVHAQTSTTCLDLKYDLYQGLRDSTDGSVLHLQNFLVKSGYLTATPNGYFGQSTLAAVKKFQNANNISTTGRVGPSTRAAIKNISCLSKPLTVETKPNTTTSQGTPPNPAVTVTAPSSASILTEGNQYTIRWPHTTGAIYEIALENNSGVGYGLIAGSATGGSYDWKVGNVYSSKSNSYITVAPGTYRLHFRNSGFMNVQDQYSALFTIVGRPINVNAIIPTSISRGTDNSLAISGSGFDTSTAVHMIYNGYVITYKPIYISPDGKLLVFNINSGIDPNQYQITVNNSYEDGATSTPSNYVNLNITN